VQFYWNVYFYSSYLTNVEGCKLPVFFMVKHSGTLRTGSNLFTLPRNCAETIMKCTAKANGSMR